MKKLIFLIPIILLMSCSVKKPFTGAIVKNYGVDKETISDIQFYVSEKIKIKIFRDTLIVRNHKPRTISTKEKVKIKKNTPCAVQDFNSNNTVLYVSFNKSGKSIPFFTRRGGEYSIQVRRDKNLGEYIEYGGEKYEYVKGGDAILLCKLKHYSRKDETKRLKGIKL